MLEKRAMTPDTSAVAMPARKPPRLIDHSEKPCGEKAEGGTGQDGMRHRIAHQAHAAQEGGDADRAAAERQRKNGNQRPPHEAG